MLIECNYLNVRSLVYERNNSPQLTPGNVHLTHLPILYPPAFLLDKGQMVGLGWPSMILLHLFISFSPFLELEHLCFYYNLNDANDSLEEWDEGTIRFTGTGFGQIERN